MKLIVTPHKEREEETHMGSQRTGSQVTACGRGRVVDKGKPPQAKGYQSWLTTAPRTGEKPGTV